MASSSLNHDETTDVVICGCGPTGAMLSAYLGRATISNIVLEKEPDITTDPRGIALDEDGIRFLQGLGLYEHVFSDIGTCIPKVRFVSGVHNDLNKQPFLNFDISSTAGHTGHVAMLSHKQPALEERLRSKIQDDEWVYTRYLSANGVERCIRSRFLVGADGKTGFTRKQYLEPRGVHMQWAEKMRYQETWVALNWKLSLPTPKTHPSFPLWKLGYSPEDVFDLFFPLDFRFLCNPQRPAVCGRFGPPSDRLWRFEFLVNAGESDAEMATPAMIRKVVYPYLRHPGARYGLPDPVEFPHDCIEVLRCRPFRFSARSCDRWALGRVILCGDAAHVFPPFGGQGIASGFRDAISLSWRLAVACRSQAANHEQLFTGWFLERKQQLESSLATTIRNGDMVNSRNPFKIFVRDWTLWFLQLLPGWKSWLELGPRIDGPTTYKYEPGMAFIPELGGGVLFSQTYCVALGGQAEVPRVQFSDDAIFAKTKESPFQIVVLLDNLDELQAARQELKVLDGASSESLSVREATFFVPRLPVSAHQQKQPSELDGVYRAASAEEFAASSLCKGRPAPRGYHEDDLWKSAKGRRFVIVRPDRFIFAMCDAGGELERICSGLAKLSH
ncbi:monooxygenase [Purpureocillium lilacinum]|uniref:Monooxygenase n=1 Tax=Purpureocillium lilacinum TaxID=33203 RepID=A0A2U3EF14_PURLI|nr:monooxygenase [Purpureocillium lilacinum]